ncbi:Uu.00g083340.m01.CDS01 [Anthostomella pinea]|uniref:Uu.00g083340.m01.CDS01 n=1 Tax=Anthostomella pinea TaxID=933095 RepID=A0AAI8VG54_9PEZI|nr:Uu.00g083340.m01.CDS01 [Anthostomella pinea]
MLKAEEYEEFFIELDAKAFLWACRGGLKKLARELGFDKVDFDPISTPKRIIITGTAKVYEAAMAIMESRTHPESQGSSPGTQDCSVCWTEAENPIRTQCNHVYCLDCFENMCTSATTQGYGDQDYMCRRFWQL